MPLDNAAAMSERLNNDFFRRLAQSIPGFKAEYAKKASEKKAQSNGKILQPPCVICGARFGSKTKEFSLTQQKIKPACPSCNQNLQAGYCCAVTHDGKRFAFVKWPEMGDLAGRIQLVSEETMDAIQTKYGKREAN